MKNNVKNLFCDPKSLIKFGMVAFSVICTNASATDIQSNKSSIERELRDCHKCMRDKIAPKLVRVPDKIIGRIPEKIQPYIEVRKEGENTYITFARDDASGYINGYIKHKFTSYDWLNLAWVLDSILRFNPSKYAGFAYDFEDIGGKEKLERLSKKFVKWMAFGSNEVNETRIFFMQEWIDRVITPEQLDAVRCLLISILCYTDGYFYKIKQISELEKQLEELNGNEQQQPAS